VWELAYQDNDPASRRESEGCRRGNKGESNHRESAFFFMNERVLVLLNPEKTRGQADKNIYANSDNMDGKATSLYGQFLINSVLNKSLLIHSHTQKFVLSFLQIRKGARELLDLCRSRFFSQSDGHKKKYNRLSKCNMICGPKDQGGLGS
jgi:hypothetical protein